MHGITGSPRPSGGCNPGDEGAGLNIARGVFFLKTVQEKSLNFKRQLR